MVLFLVSALFMQQVPVQMTHSICWIKHRLYLFVYDVASNRWGGTVLRALASHQCGPGSIPGPGVICRLYLLLVPVFPSP